MLLVLSGGLVLCLWVSWQLPWSAAWRVTLCAVELAYALPIGFIWWRTRPRRLLLGRDGRLSLWYPGGHRLDTRINPGVTVHATFVVLPLPRRVGFSRYVYLDKGMAGADEFRRLRAWLRTSPAP